VGLPRKDSASIMSERLTVAITGTLAIPRDDAATRINATDNARFVTKVAANTDFLVATRFDTVNAHKAASCGSVIISEPELMGFLDAGEFPKRKHRKSLSGTWPEITWTRVVEDPRTQLLEYKDAHGVSTLRFVAITRYGTGPENRPYFEAFDGLGLKTFREDRVVSITELKASY
jgi:hypothetical protein